MAIKKLTPDVVRKDLGAVRMWHDDIVQLVRLIEETCSSRTLQADEYQLEDAQDLGDLQALRVDEFSIDGDAGRVRVVLGPSGSWLEVREPDRLLRGLISDVEALARTCRYVPIASIVHELLLILVKQKTGRAVRAANAAKIFSRTRTEAPTFWDRKKDDIWIAIVAALVGGAIGYLVNQIT